MFYLLRRGEGRHEGHSHVLSIRGNIVIAWNFISWQGLRESTAFKKLSGRSRSRASWKFWQIACNNFWRATDLRAISIGETPGLVTESPGLILKRGRVYVLVSSSGCLLGWPPDVFLDIYRYGGRFKDRPSVPIPYSPEVRSTVCARHVLLEQTCSVIYYSLIFFFNPLLCWHVPYISYWRRFWSSHHIFFCFCNTCLFVSFGTSLGVAGPNIILLYSGMVSKSIHCNRTRLFNL